MTGTRHRRTPASAAPSAAGTATATEPSSSARRELLAEEVLDKAAALFAARGFAATSLKDVADAVGLSRSSIYYYYPNKEALLAELIRGVTLPIATMLREVGETGLPPTAAIREVVRRLVLWVADPQTHFRLMDRSEAELPPAIAKVHAAAKRQILAELIALVDAAVLAGEARAVDSRVTALSIVGMAMWTAWWFQPGHGPTLDTVAEMIAGNACASLHRAGPIKSGATIASLAGEIRDNLALIEAMSAEIPA
ncbi:TetR/AcrR family transcriptional regulator [uncultured Sphingomonas sp.]|uniref:TetR/AcrR family transcriptional regulator n=1 Tax=uncultured Sphingomonas sp. TaxID=158754 RepID=UPI0035CC00B7